MNNDMSYTTTYNPIMDLFSNFNNKDNDAIERNPILLSPNEFTNLVKLIQKYMPRKTYPIDWLLNDISKLTESTTDKYIAIVESIENDCSTHTIYGRLETGTILEIIQSIMLRDEIYNEYAFILSDTDVFKLNEEYILKNIFEYSDVHRYVNFLEFNDDDECIRELVFDLNTLVKIYDTSMIDDDLFHMYYNKLEELFHRHAYEICNAYRPKLMDQIISKT